MYIDIFKNNGTEYIRLRESYRTKTAEGKVAIRKRTICNIGPLSKFDDGGQIISKDCVNHSDLATR